MIMNLYIPASLIILLSLFLPAACVRITDIPDKTPPREAQPVQGVEKPVSSQRPVQGRDLPASSEKQIGESSQILLVRNMDPASVDVQVILMEKKDGRWQSLFSPMNGVIGRNGFAPTGEKREGDGRTPSGIFLLGMVFGYGSSAVTIMPYRQAADEDLWVDDVQADDYNQWVKKGATRASSFEKMRRDDDLYKYGIVVEYNTHPVVKGFGSAIFFHLWKEKGWPTAGCVAMSEEDLMKVLRWLNPKAMPLTVMGTNVTIGGY